MQFLKTNIAKIALFIGLGGLIYFKLSNSKRFIKWYISKAYNTLVWKYADAIYRIETGNFTSNIFKHTKGAGVIAFKKYKPFGHRPKLFKGVATIGIYRSKNGLNYVRFLTLLDGYKFVANYLTHSGYTLEKIRNRVKLFGSQNPDYLKIIENAIT